MDINEISQILAESKNKEFYDNLSLNIDYPHISFKKSINGLISIYDFVKRQVDGFKLLGEIPSELNDIKTTFERCLKQAQHLLKIENLNKGEWDSAFSQLTNNRPPKFLYNSPETSFLISLYTEKRESYQGAIEFFYGQIQNITNKNYFIGYVMAYEFQSKQFSEILKRKKHEQKSIGQIQVEFDNLFEKCLNNTESYINSTFDKYNQYTTLIDQLKIDKETLFTEWFNSEKEIFSKFHLDSNRKIKNLEELYIEKLKLEAPARYWKQRAIKLRKEGIIWTSGLFISVGLTVLILLNLLSNLSDSAVLNIFSNTGTAIKWSILLVTIISFLAFAIRTFSKLTFSSFHLMRDAEEKEQLTYVYLALAKEKGIDPTERHLIMQSLFSRADSGLLKEDASPTMPGNIIDRALTKPN